MKHFLIAATLAVFGTAAGAIPLAPGTVVFPTGTTAVDPVHGGLQTVINDNLIDFTMDPDPGTPLTVVGGALQNRVTENDRGTLNFAPRIRDTFNIEANDFAIVAMQLTGFGSFDLDADFRTDGLGDLGPTSYSRSADGDLITMRYTDPTAPGPNVGGLLVQHIAPGLQETSLFPSLVSDATAFELTGRATIFGYFINEDEYNASGRIVPDGDLISVSVGGLAVPVAPVPLPAPALLLIVGLGGLGLMRRKIS